MSTTSIYKTPVGEKAIMDLYDNLLKSWPVPHETLNIPTRHGQTFVIASGEPSAPPMILLHGAGSNSSIWAKDVISYSRTYRTYAVDLVGEAGRSAPNRPDWNGPAFTEWLEDVLKALKIEKAVLLGMSQGGWTALKYAVAHPDRVEKLVLICPGGVTPDKMSFVFKSLLYSLMGKRGIKRMAQLLYADQPLPDGVEEVTAILIRNFRPRIGKLPLFSDEELQRLTIPALLVGGTKDALRDNVQIGTRLQKCLPQLKIRLLPGAGHAVMSPAEHVLPFLVAEQVAAEAHK